MTLRSATGVMAAAALFGVAIARWALQTPAVRSVEPDVLRQYAGVYQWHDGGLLYLQLWSELSNQLVAFDDAGDVRALYSTEHDRFIAGPGAALATSIESRVDFQRDARGTPSSLTWRRGETPARVAQRVNIERHEDVRFSNGDTRLAGTLISPNTGSKHPAVILVHGSGPMNRESVLPFARFLIRHGMAVLGYDKRGVGGSTGDWNTASFDDLAGDVVAAFESLKARPDIDSSQIGLLGWSQAGWVMPLAAVRAKDVAFLISVSGAGVTAAETTIDHAQNEMTAAGMKPPVVAQVVALMKLQYRVAQTGEGWEEYVAAREPLAARMGSDETFPAARDHKSWAFMRRLYFYDPGHTLRELRTPTLALFGELDNNILAKKNLLAWETAFKDGRNEDYTLQILPKANHIHFEASLGTNAEIGSLQRFVPSYFTTIREWLAKRIRGFEVGPA